MTNKRKAHFHESVKSSFFDDINEEDDKEKPTEKTPLWVTKEEYAIITDNKREALSDKILAEDVLYHQEKDSTDISQHLYVLYQDRIECFDVREELLFKERKK